MEEAKNVLRMHTFEDVVDSYSTYISSKEGKKLISDAFEYALKKHEGQYRKSGEPYIHHLIEVAYILTTLRGGPATIASGLLHDVVEDTDTPIEEIAKLFGEDVANIVESLTKIQRMKLSKRSNFDFEAEDHRKIFLGMAKDIRVIMVKLADRLHNMRTLDSLSPERQIALSKETLEVFAPIAHRLGINTVKSELEDLCLKYLEPIKYKEITELLNKKTKNRTKSLDSLKKRIADIVFENKIPFEMESRVKSIYSIYKKIYIKGHNFDDIYDILAIRIITQTELNCYEILGLIHATYKPIPGRFKDYIAVPKPNMYQSLHTSIISGDGNIFEVQIRTKEMDEVAETGIAAHWRYKEGNNYNAKAEQKEIEEKLHWFRDFVDMSRDQIDENAKEYMDSLRHDIFESNVYVFTPMGKVIDLPNGATPLDFAYKIHSRIGEKAVGAIVNNHLVPLNTVLKTGDVVEIKTNPNSQGPNEGWLKIATTNNALTKIRKFLFKKNEDLIKEDRISRGKQLLLDVFEDRGLDKDESIAVLENNFNQLSNNYNINELDELYLAIANRNPTATAVVDFLKIRRQNIGFKLSKNTIDNSSCPVDVGNAGKVAVTLGSCCTPIPGDDIVGYITKGKGITIHRVNCPNVNRNKVRLIDVNWKEHLELKKYPVDIAIECNDRNNLLVDVMSAFSQHGVNVSSINATQHLHTLTTTIKATVHVSDAKRLTDIFNFLLNINSVYKVYRVIH